MLFKQDIMDRREFLKKLGFSASGIVLACSGLSTLGQNVFWPTRKNSLPEDERYDFLMPRVRFDCDHRVPDKWDVYPGADRNLLSEFASIVRCKVKPLSGCDNQYPHYGTEDQFNAVVDFDDYKSLKQFPYAFMTAEGAFTFSSRQQDNLKRYICEGGFLHMDDCCFDGRGDFFYQAAYVLLEKTFGPGSVREIPRKHEVFHNVFDLGDIGLPYMQGVQHGARGVFIGDRLAVFLSSTDLNCGWTRCWFGKVKQDQAIQMGINILMYVLAH
jgi:hypothetical protein